jgi:hypothetical protein
MSDGGGEYDSQRKQQRSEQQQKRQCTVGYAVEVSCGRNMNVGAMELLMATSSGGSGHDA